MNECDESYGGRSVLCQMSAAMPCVLCLLIIGILRLGVEGKKASTQHTAHHTITNFTHARGPCPTLRQRLSVLIMSNF